MYVCYVDEAGCPGALPHATSDVQPVLALCGLIVPHARLKEVTRSFLSEKIRFSPQLRQKHWLDGVKAEIKGSDLRSEIRNKGRNRRRQVIHFLNQVLGILEANDCRIISRIYVKQPAGPFDGRSVYTASMQSFCVAFQRFLQEQNCNGFMIADNRTPQLNSSVAHSILTQKFQAAGDPYDRIVELPTFGGSENHIPLQITDVLCSSLLFPMTSHAYCTGHVRSVHVNGMDKIVRTQFTTRMQVLSYRYRDGAHMRGGIYIKDAILERGSAPFFNVPV